MLGTGLTVSPTASDVSSTVAVAGTAANGSPLEVDGQRVSGLAPGENTILIEVRAQDGSSETYALTLEVSDDVRAVAEGDAIVQQGDCDPDTGCDGTLNGVGGRFACNGMDFSSETPNVQISVSGLCLLSVSEGVVTSAAGWFFGSFPEALSDSIHAE